MIKVIYSELDGPNGPTCRLEAAGHAGYAPAGQDIVCAGASTLMQALVYLLAGVEGSRSTAGGTCEGPRVAVTAQIRQEPWIQGAFEMAKAGFALLAERYPDNLSFADTSARGEKSMVDLQLFAEGGDGAAEGEAAAPDPAPELSRAQRQQAIAAGTLKPEQKAESPAPAPKAPPEQPQQKAEPQEKTPPRRPPLPPRAQNAVRSLHARWAAEEAQLRRENPDFSLRSELKNPEMRRLMRMPGMRMRDAYRLTHYDELAQSAARAVEQGVVERIQQRAGRPAENGVHPGGAAVTQPSVERMTRAQREALERQALHGAKIQF